MANGPHPVHDPCESERQLTQMLMALVVDEIGRVGIDEAAATFSMAPVAIRHILSIGRYVAEGHNDPDGNLDLEKAFRMAAALELPIVQVMLRAAESAAACTS